MLQALQGPDSMGGWGGGGGRGASLLFLKPGHLRVIPGFSCPLYPSKRMPEARLLSGALLPDFHRLGQLDVLRNLPDAHGSLDFPNVSSDCFCSRLKGVALRGSITFCRAAFPCWGLIASHQSSSYPEEAGPKACSFGLLPLCSRSPLLVLGLMWGLLRGTPWRISRCRRTPSAPPAPQTAPSELPQASRCL